MERRGEDLPPDSPTESNMGESLIIQLSPIFNNRIKTFSLVCQNTTFLKINFYAPSLRGMAFRFAHFQLPENF